MGLENLKSVFAKGAGINNSQIGGRHGIASHPEGHSILDNIQQMENIPIKEGSSIIPPTVSQLSELGLDIATTQSWDKLYNSDHTSIDGTGYNYSQFVDRGNLNIRKGSTNSMRYNSLLGVGEPYMVSNIGNQGRNQNRGDRYVPIFRAKTDSERILKYLSSPAGLKWQAEQNLYNIGPNQNKFNKFNNLTKI